MGETELITLTEKITELIERIKEAVIELKKIDDNTRKP